MTAGCFVAGKVLGPQRFRRPALERDLEAALARIAADARIGTDMSRKREAKVERIAGNRTTVRQTSSADPDSGRTWSSAQKKGPEFGRLMRCWKR